MVLIYNNLTLDEKQLMHPVQYYSLAFMDTVSWLGYVENRNITAKWFIFQFWN